MRAAWLVLLFLTGCERSPAPAPLPSASAATSSAPDPVTFARRPTRRYYLGRTAARCEYYAVDLDGVSPPTPTPCPPDLQIGERIRIAGRTCARESPDADRRQPVVCPDPLTNLEKRDRGSTF